jgi:methylase of polypeptide subunit release factors
VTDISAPPVEVMDFGGLRIHFDSRVLRPRTWTIAQSRWVADLARDADNGDVLELCCGAGHVGLLAISESRRRLVCVDVDPVAVTYTRSNAATNALADRVEVRESPLAEALAPEERFPVIVADPPWVPAGQTARFPEDPLLAIDGGPDGLGVARACVEVIIRHLAPGGAAVIQLGTPEQAARVTDLLGPTPLRPGELREYGDRGVLLRIDHPRSSSSRSGSLVV